MEQDRRGILDRSETKKMCSLNGNETGEMCSPADADTCGDGMFTTSDELVEILCFSHFTSYMTFLPTGKKGRKKRERAA